MSETSARASRFAFWFGSFARKGLIGARRAGAPAEGPAAAGDDVPAPVAGRAPAVSGLAAFGAKLGSSPVSRFWAGIGAALETVGRIGDGSPPREGPVVGAARPVPAGDAPWFAPIAGGAPAGGPGRGGIAGGGPAADAGRCAATPRGAVGRAAAPGGTKGRAGPRAAGAGLGGGGG